MCVYEPGRISRTLTFGLGPTSSWAVRTVTGSAVTSSTRVRNSCRPSSDCLLHALSIRTIACVLLVPSCLTSPTQILMSSSSASASRTWKSVCPRGLATSSAYPRVASCAVSASDTHRNHSSMSWLVFAEFGGDSSGARRSSPMAQGSVSAKRARVEPCRRAAELNSIFSFGRAPRNALPPAVSCVLSIFRLIWLIVALHQPKVGRSRARRRVVRTQVPTAATRSAADSSGCVDRRRTRALAGKRHGCGRRDRRLRLAEATASREADRPQRAAHLSPTRSRTSRWRLEQSDRARKANRHETRCQQAC